LQLPRIDFPDTLRFPFQPADKRSPFLTLEKILRVVRFQDLEIGRHSLTDKPDAFHQKTTVEITEFLLCETADELRSLFGQHHDPPEAVRCEENHPIVHNGLWRIKQ
jgi:hypothetical protein